MIAAAGRSKTPGGWHSAPRGAGYSGGVPTLREPRGYNFAVDGSYFDDVVWPALAHRFPQFERTRCVRTLPGLQMHDPLSCQILGA